MSENPYEAALEGQITDNMRKGLPDPTKGKEEMTFDEWLEYGTTRSWNSAPICFKHDGVPDPDEDCTHYILVYKSTEATRKMNIKFAPSTWRAHSRGHKWWNLEI